MIQLDGIDFPNESPAEIVSDMIAYVNDRLQNQGIVDEDGEPVVLEANDASLTYQVLLAQANKIAQVQSMIYNMGTQFNLGEASDRQVVEISRIMRSPRKQPSFTTIIATIQAADTGDVYVTNQLTATANSNTGVVVFKPAHEVLIPSGGIKSVILVAQDAGPITVAQNTITSFDQNVPNIEYMLSSEGLQGNDLERVSDLRARLENNNVKNSFAELARAGIAGLTGITYCAVYVNPSNQSDLMVADVAIGPRSCLVVVQGFSEYVATEYFKYMLMETTDTGDERTIAQPYQLQSGNLLDFYFMLPSYREVYVAIYIDIQTIQERVDLIKDALFEINGTMGIGEQLNAARVIQKMASKNFDFNSVGAEISMDGVSWSVESAINGLQIAALPYDNIRVIHNA
jgi:hypothetical protein